MVQFNRLFLFMCCSAGILFISAGCKDKLGSSNNYTTDEVKQAAALPSADNIAFTLPVLDALFFEDGFEAQIKEELKLTDDQLRQLKSVSGSYVAALTEEGNNLGSARQANSSALAQLKKIIGEQKASTLLNIVAARYANGDIAALLPVKPNAVPSDTRIVVNAPAFRMDVYENGELLKTYRIGIGYPEFPLPTGMRAITNIIFNPTWTPPDEAWVKGKFKPGRKVSADSKDNPLGVIKIPIGMPSLIHGGKVTEKLGNFASHGCVGLTNDQVQDFSALVGQISGTPITLDSIKSFEKNRAKTKTAKLNRLIPVELRYETIVAENGRLIIYRDVYERGTNTLSEVEKILGIYGISLQSLPQPEQHAIQTALQEMNLDANGKPIANLGINPDSTKNISDSDTEHSVKKGKVTRSVKGKTQVVVAVAALHSKGYPAPVNLDAGKLTHQ
ncbi:L,D-transpeptidase [Niabella yanshanensis]|uniref:L,D-transpeptidase n=1 Tax=Niabella yanshanensis TaxID=577386 RepID=A0ABZ0W839_9BACT|nr:L,D-transpeptidase [Niabella yanshanensis]WQD38773.1 L,D-transpeptidase [Niabella yanshanensis]